MGHPSQKALILPAKRGNFVVGLAVVHRPGPSEVLVRIEAAALNPVEWKIQTLGAYVETYPAILGTDAAGVVEEVGSEVTTLAKGDSIFWQGFFEPQYGTYQQYSVVPAELAAKASAIPSNFSVDNVSALPVAICTAVLGMYNCNPASKSAHFIPPWEKDGLTANAGKPILIMGGASSVGQAVIQMARLSGFSPIVTTASPHNISLLTALGADHVLDRNTSQQELLSQIATSMAGAPLTFAYDTISSSETQHVAYNALASGGTLIITWEKLITPAEERTSEGKKIAEVFASVYAPENREVGVALFKQLPGWLESKALEPNTVEVLPDGLGGITTGLERIKVGVSATKLVVHPQETP